MSENLAWWHFCHASDRRKSERIQERLLRAVFCDKMSSYHRLLDIADPCTLQNRRPQDLAILMYKTKNKIWPKYIADLFQILSREEICYAKQLIFYPLI